MQRATVLQLDQSATHFPLFLCSALHLARLTQYKNTGSSANAAFLLNSLAITSYPVKCNTKWCITLYPPFKKTKHLSGISTVQVGNHFSSSGLDLILKANMLRADAQNEKAAICHFHVLNNTQMFPSTSVEKWEKSVCECCRCPSTTVHSLVHLNTHIYNKNRYSGGTHNVEYTAYYRSQKFNLINREKTLKCLCNINYITFGFPHTLMSNNDFFSTIHLWINTIHDVFFFTKCNRENMTDKYVWIEICNLANLYCYKDGYNWRQLSKKSIKSPSASTIICQDVFWNAVKSLWNSW